MLSTIGIFFEWISEECESAYFNSLSSRHTFRMFWNQRRDWRQNAGEAISLCLDKLELTGIDEDNGELSAFWADTFDDGDYPPTEEWLVKLVRKEHTWTRFLRDSPEVLTMAVMDSKCLDFNDLTGYDRRCRQPRPTTDGKVKIWDLGFPVLETAIQVNEKVARDLVKDGKLEKIEINTPGIYAWSTEKLKKNTKFSLGGHGTLVVYAQSNFYCPPIMSWRPIMCETLHEFKNVGLRENLIGGCEEKHHHEYISGSWSCKPLRVLVLSTSTGKEKGKEPMN